MFSLQNKVIVLIGATDSLAIRIPYNVSRFFICVFVLLYGQMLKV